MRNEVERHVVDRVMHDQAYGRRGGPTVSAIAVEDIVSEAFEVVREQAFDRAMSALRSHFPERFAEAYRTDPQFKAAVYLMVQIVTGATLGDIGLTPEEQAERDKATMKLTQSLSTNGGIL